MHIRNVVNTFNSQPTIEGAGVKLHRAFGFNQLPRFDPFLMLDDFRSDNPEDFKAGFPWHPHRGMETITYVLEGEVAHEDSLGNKGDIGAGEVQWMTAGSGIIHQESPKGSSKGTLQGFQLWANLPAKYKLMEPRYQNLTASSIPVVELDGGSTARLIAGRLGDQIGPVEDIVTDPVYLDVRIPSLLGFDYPVKLKHTVFIYMIDGEISIAESNKRFISRQVVLFGQGDRIQLTSGKQGARFLLISGKPLLEPISWHGPIVMNTHEEIEAAFDELDRGTFIKLDKKPIKTF
jgi:quercetin 2,3-dioxygenase